MKADTSADLRKRWFTVHMSKAPGGGFEVTVDGFPALKCHAASSDEALSLTSHALERLEIEGAAVPNRGIYSWEEYVSGGLCPIGKMAFADLPSGQRFLRENFPTMWDKLSSTTACPLPSEGEPTQIPAAEIVWHHVWALSDELTPSERQERLSWSGNPNLHF